MTDNNNEYEYQCSECKQTVLETDKNCPTCGADLNEIVFDDEAKYKKCPYCAEEILSDAVKCKHCGEWLKKSNSKNNYFATTGLIFGVASIFFHSIGMIPTVAVVLSFIGIVKFKESRKGKVQAWIGLILGIIYTIMYLNIYGHI